MWPGEGQAEQTGDVVAESVATYSENPDAFAAFGAASVADSFAKFAALLPPAAIVLDAGCGPGRDLERLARLGHKGVGIDLNREFLLRAQMVGPTILGDLRAIPIGSESFDAVWASASLIHLRHQDAVLAINELARVAKPGAPLGISVKTGGETGWAEDLPMGRRWFYDWASEEFVGALESAELSVREVSSDGRWIDVRASR